MMALFCKSRSCNFFRADNSVGIGPENCGIVSREVQIRSGGTARHTKRQQWGLGQGQGFGSMRTWLLYRDRYSRLVRAARPVGRVPLNLFCPSSR